MFCMTCRGRGDALCSVDEMEVFELLGDDESLREPIAAPYEFMAAVWMFAKGGGGGGKDQTKLMLWCCCAGRIVYCGLHVQCSASNE